MTAIRPAWVETNGVATRYQLSGSGESIVVLIHEMGGTLETYDSLAERLERKRRVLRYDVRGSGLSENVRGSLSMDDLTADLDALLAAVAPRGRVIVCGCAVGGAIAIKYAATRPQTAALIATSPATGVPAERKAPLMQRAADLEQSGARPSMEERLASSYPPILRENKAAFEANRLRRLAMNSFGTAAMMRMLAGLDLTADFARIRCPSLILAGQHDGDRPPEGVEKVAKQIPGVVFKTLPSGHFMHVHAPDLVAAEYEAFLAQHAL